MGAESSTVRIVIDVDENSGESVGRVQSNLSKLGSTAGMAGQQVRRGMEEAGTGMASAREKAHLLTEEFGIRLPRAFRNLIAESKTAQTVLNGIGSALVGIAGIQIGAIFASAAIDGVEKLWHNVLNVNAALEDYNAEFGKKKDEDFGNTRSIATTRLRIDEATAAVKAYHEMAARLKAQGDSPIHALDPGAIGYYWEAHDAEVKAMEWQRQVDTLKRERSPEQTHRSNLDEIAMKYAGDARLRGEPKITAELQKQYEIIAENARVETEEESKFGNPVPQGSSLWSTGHLSNASTETLKADSDADNERFNQRREQAQELRRIHEEALESGLRGSALYHAQEAFAIDDLKNKGLASARAVDDVRAKFHNEEIKRLEEQRREVEKIERAAGAIGLTGIAKARREGEDRIASVRDSDFEDVDAHGRSALADRQRAAIVRETDGEITEERRQAAAEIARISDESAAHEISGFGRIKSEASKQIDDLRTKIEAAYGTAPRIGPSSRDQAEGASLIKQGTGIIDAGAARESADLMQRNADETAQIEAEAREKSLSGERQKTEAIEAEYDARIAKDEEWRKQQLDGANLSNAEIASINENANRREVAAAQERDGEMVAASREARMKMAAEFDSLFKNLDHPLKALAGLGDKVAGEAAASLVQRLQQRSQGGAGSGRAALPGGDIISEIFGGNVFGGRKSTNITNSTNVTDIASGAPHAHSATTMPGRMQIASAQIEIGSATFAGGGGAPSGAGGAGASYFGSRATSSGGSVPGIAGGSTGLLAPSGSFYRPAYTGAGSAASGANWSGSGATYTASGAGGGMAYASPSSNGVYGGGAGDPTGARAATNFGGSSAASPAHKSVIGGIVGGVQQGMGLFKGAKAAFGAGGSSSGDQDQYAETQDPVLSGTLNADGSFSSSGSTNNGMLGGGGIGANAAGAMGGALGLYSAYQGGGGVSGAASGAMSGMEFGMAIGGPIGAGIGAVGGAILGAIGFGGREKARVYDLKTVRPALKNDQDSYDQGSMDYLTAFSAMQTLQNQAFAAISPMGPAARAYRNDTIDPEIKQAEAKLSAAERAGRSNYTAQAAQYDIGADSVPRDGYAMIHENERIVPSDQNERITRALENGSTMPVQQSDSGWTGDLHVHAIDARGVADFFDKHKHLMRGSLNDSYAENSGGGLA